MSASTKAFIRKEVELWITNTSRYQQPEGLNIVMEAQLKISKW